tara:strand:+ start:1499 stop:2590 length:1092 start_codon:yes stop_codon:yes gene_type:complete
MNLPQPISLLLTATLLFGQAASAEDNDRFARIVLFVDETVEVPEGYQTTLGSLAERTELFIDQWMTHWELPIERKSIFSRDSEGAIEVTLIQGKLLNSNGRAALPDLQRQAMQKAGQQLKLGPDKETIWWIFYHYEGVKGFQGGVRGSGGMAVNAFPDDTAKVDPSWELASEPMVEDSLKGTIHEFGHALGLPHIGPRPGLDLGNSLMGPINKSYWGKSGTDDERVYLNEACAALLCRHPVFKSSSSSDPEMPAEIQVKDLTAIRSNNGENITIRGNLQASGIASTVVAVDSERHQFGDYWSRSYTGKVDPETGAFEINITEPFESGTVYLSFCFDNGVNTSDGKQIFQRGSSLTIQYPQDLK